MDKPPTAADYRAAADDLKQVACLVEFPPDLEILHSLVERFESLAIEAECD